MRKFCIGVCLCMLSYHKYFYLWLLSQCIDVSKTWKYFSCWEQTDRTSMLKTDLHVTLDEVICIMTKRERGEASVPLEQFTLPVCPILQIYSQESQLLTNNRINNAQWFLVCWYPELHICVLVSVKGNLKQT